MVIERNLARALDAKVNLDFDPDGLRCHIVIPGVRSSPRAEREDESRLFLEPFAAA